jgi:hypothetical protein
MSPFASNPANFVKNSGDCTVVIVLNSKSRVHMLPVVGEASVPFSTNRCRMSSAELALSVRKFPLSCGISTKLGFGPSSIEWA